MSADKKTASGEPMPTEKLMARLKLKPVTPQRRVPIEPARQEDPRRSRRNSACMQGTIHSSRLSEPVHCLVRDISATGARLDLVKGDRKPFTAEELLPDRFTLQMRLDRTEVDCELVWRKVNVIGVRYVSLPRAV